VLTWPRADPTLKGPSQPKQRFLVASREHSFTRLGEGGRGGVGQGKMEGWQERGEGGDGKREAREEMARER